MVTILNVHYVIIESYRRLVDLHMTDMLSDAVLGSFPPMSQTTHEVRDDVITVHVGNMAVIRGCQHVPYSRPPADIEYLLNGSSFASSR